MRPDAKEIKTRIDLVEYLTSLGIELKPVGAGGEYRGLCPFHDEAAPSFQVNRRKGLWHCFDCGAGGDVISFVMKRERVGFQEALATLSLSTGEGRYPTREGTGSGCILCAAADYWHKRLDGSTSTRSWWKEPRAEMSSAFSGGVPDGEEPFHLRAGGRVPPIPF